MNTLRPTLLSLFSRHSTLPQPLFHQEASMKVKQILTGVELVIADLEVELNGTAQGSH